MNSIFDSNEALGGNGNSNSGDTGSDAGSAYGGAIEFDGGGALGLTTTATVSNGTITRNRAIGGAGNTAGSADVLVGASTGGGLVLLDAGTATLDVSDSLIALNQALGGQGGDSRDGDDARGGGLATIDGGYLTVSTSTLAFNEVVGGQGGAGGDGLGGGIYTESSALGVASLTVSRSAIVLNQADGGPGGTGGSDGRGVVVYISPLGTFGFDTFTIIAHNHASTSNDNVFSEAIPEATSIAGNRGVGLAEDLQPSRTGGRSAC
jgi:hypothetical protein